MRQSELASASPQEMQSSPDLMNKELEQLRPVLKNFILKLCSGDPQAENDVDDVAQETLVKIYKHLDQFEARGGGNLKNWAITIAKNEFGNYQRHRRALKRGRTVSIDNAVQMNGKDGLEEGNHSFESIIGGKDGAEWALINADLLEKSLKALPKNQKKVLRLHYYDDLSVEEIAAQLSLTESAVKSRLNRAREALKDIMGRLERTQAHKRKNN